MSLLHRVGVSVLASVLIALGAAQAQALDKIPDAYKINGFAIGCQSWTFKNFTVFEAIRLTHEAGGKVIEFFPGQPLSPEHRVGFDHNASDEVINEVLAQCKKYDVLPVNYGVLTPHGDKESRKAEWHKIFEFAKKMNLYGVTGEPEAEDMDAIEKDVKEFDLHFSIHDHFRQPWNPSYKFWDPHYVLSLVQGRDPRIGACADTGHWLSSGVDPVEALHLLKGRVMSAHMKDRNIKGPAGHDVPWGTGVGEVKQILQTLKEQGFEGHIDVEYEYHEKKDPATDAPVSFPEVKQSIEFIKQLGQTAGN